ncbi:glycoside hydrolase family 32 protein [Streptomyces sp. ISL-22]|uniref:glycoside hydrolase family 32 protein n=1 Tax=unclassified Streptomyces TaxID=2593676 RepID=UPI001BE6AD27|nr:MULTISPECIES: GH32 C-terminal domain-containing protein [unclassified Streptomyces]MBT2418943.1 glycoside hydrolase family 32 protein [Streptomyces sp. ISL-24]MBT2435295.1 glycoside hydrolase family 32 protein [Streptomyces sp. ISL-22]
MRGLSRRALFAGSAAGASTALLPTASPAAAESRAASKPKAAAESKVASKPKAAATCASYRAAYHFTVPGQWKNDPQRPVWIDGEYRYYYLYNADYFTGVEGTAWRLATSTDLVSFTDRGIAVPKDTTPNGDVWSGSAVVDTHDTAGFGAGAVIVLATMSPGGGTDHQEQFLYYSTDGGRTFTPYGTDPVLPSPRAGADFRDPKVIRDEDRDRWVMALAEGTKVGFYHSADLKQWTYAGGFVKEGIGTLECPDLFRITAEDGTVQWVLGVSANGKGSGLPNTYAYWTGSFDGSAFTADAADPQWLDNGWDWYGAVTFEKHRSDGSVDPSARYAMGWLNNWDYAHITPTIDCDGFNGTDSIVREITLKRASSGTYYLASRPVAALDDHVSRTVNLGDLEVTGTRVLDYRGTSYEVTCEITWDQLTGAGLQLRRSPDGGRHVDAGIYRDFAFLNRRPTVNPDASGRWQESHSPFEPSARTVKLRILVDRTSVEMFVDDGRYVHSSEVFPYLIDTGLALFTIDGTAVFRNTVIREFAVE